MIPMNLNSNSYKLSGATSSSSITLTPEDAKTCSLEIYNAGLVDVFLVSGVTAPTAVFPTSATAPVAGKVIPSKAVTTFTKNTDHGFVSGITESGTASVYISAGTGA